MTNEQSTNYAALLNDLWNTPGREKWWPDRVELRGIYWMYLGNAMHPKHAYAIVKFHAEEWLMGQSPFWTIEGTEGSVWYDFCGETPNETTDYGVLFKSSLLPEALAYAHGQEMSDEC